MPGLLVITAGWNLFNFQNDFQSMEEEQKNQKEISLQVLSNMKMRR